jgi:radical SAM enzyme (rSAM/lipoprotein system)
MRQRLLPAHQAAQRRVHDLVYLFLELTQRCNLSCRHCGSDCTAASGQPDLPKSKILEVLTGIRQRHDPGRITVAMAGGEPLLYPGLFELGRQITELGFPWGMVTNGWAWTLDTVASARKAGMRTVTVSLDGLAETHDWLRGRKGSFERAVGTLRMLVAANWIQKVDVVTCVHQRNLTQLDDLRALLIELGVKAWRLFTISPIGRAVDDPDLSLSRDEFRQLMAWIHAQRDNEGIAIRYSESGYLGACDTLVRNHPFFCRAGINVAGIMVDGSILACPNINRRFGQGNIHRDDFCEVWEKGYKPFRDRRWMRTGECVDCNEWDLCQGNSFHLRDPETNRTLLCYYNEYGLDESPCE